MASNPTEQVGTKGSYVGIPRSRIAWYPTIDEEACHSGSCAQECIAVCPQHVYSSGEGGKAVVARPFSCTVGDISCSFQCPLDAIHFPSQRELRRMLQAARETSDEGTAPQTQQK